MYCNWLGNTRNQASNCFFNNKIFGYCGQFFGLSMAHGYKIVRDSCCHHLLRGLLTERWESWSSYEKAIWILNTVHLPLVNVYITDGKITIFNG